eukprot:CAMPEP_0115113204 /NCGR_PEP_ID=MMETSP0227-20121206/41192_1 /TAXON_ID=89957 /ORGANISM="Polarella glacialis, Strain CCMP 1383" /LENGTH=160 /DNA_ID=CAMNT_0002513109 /DNA_START=246 /DNA_END=729 /DNA_ORIENTATION=-
MSKEKVAQSCPKWALGTPPGAGQTGTWRWKNLWLVCGQAPPWLMDTRPEPPSIKFWMLPVYSEEDCGKRQEDNLQSASPPSLRQQLARELLPFPSAMLDTRWQDTRWQDVACSEALGLDWSGTASKSAECRRTAHCQCCHWLSCQAEWRRRRRRSHLQKW